MSWRRRPAWLSVNLASSIGFVVWVVVLWHAIGVFAPGSDVNNIPFNSDSGVPVLQANSDRPLTIFDFYYYGAERWGGWGILAEQLVHRVTGVYWTPERLMAVQITWIFVGALALGLLHREARWVASVVYLAVLCLHVEARFLMFELSQLYAWQLPALVLAWALLRRLFDRGATPLMLAVTFVAVYLSIWSSVVSVVFLTVILSVEIVRARLTRNDRGAIVPGAIGFGMMVAATLIEHAQKAAYRSYAVTHYGESFGTPYQVDWGYLTLNVSRHWAHLAKLSWLPLYLLPLVVLLGILCVWLYAVIRKRHDLRARVMAALASDTAILVVGAFGIAVANVVVISLVAHVRGNAWDDRFLTPTNLFAPIGGALSVFLLFTLAARGTRLRAAVRSAFVAVVAALLVFRFPSSQEMPEYRQLQRTALALSERFPGGVILGGYWDTYVFPSLQPRAPLIAVPYEDDSAMRMPWALADLRRATHVIVPFRKTPVPTYPPRPDLPPPTFAQYRETFTLVDPRWFDDEVYWFALYTRDATPPRDQR